MHKGFIRSKIESRIGGIRNRVRPDSRPGRSSSLGEASTSPATAAASLPTSTSTSAVAYSNQLGRLHSTEGFLMVDEQGPPPRPPPPRVAGVGEDWEEDGMTHLSLKQGLEDPLSDMDGDLDDLVILDEEEMEEEEPRPKGGARGVEDAPSLKPWLEGSREVYEQQLELLQDHLTESMLANQSLQSENAELRVSREQLAGLRRENAILSRRLQTAAELSSNSEDAPDFASDACPKLELSGKSGGKAKRSGSSSGGGGGEEGRFGGSVLTVSSSSDGFETVSMSPDERIARQREQQRAQKKGIWNSMLEWVYEVVADFTEEHASSEDETPEKPLSAKKLKDNLQRLSRTSKPWREFLSFLQGILQWRSTAETLVVFLIYMYCVWHGWVISMLAFLAIFMLTLTYLRTSGLAEQFGFQAPPRTVDHVDDLGFGDKLQLVKRVGQTSQNRAEEVSDSLEKAQNLFLWHQPTATKKVYTNLCVLFVLSILLPNCYVLTLMGLFVGIKLFIIDNIYRKYPKVKERYDGVAKLWSSLPTDSELVKRQSLTEEQLNTSTAPSTQSGAGSEVVGATTMRQSEENVAFCGRFQLSPDEVALPSWRSGKRCSVMDRDRPLTLTRSGKLYLTHSHLCFERHNRLQRDQDRFVLSLLDVVGVAKAKPFAVLPGSGMSLEVTLKTGVKYLFSAILNRDQAYQSVLDQGMILGLPWGTDI